MFRADAAAPASRYFTAAAIRTERQRQNTVKADPSTSVPTAKMYFDGPLVRAIELLEIIAKRARTADNREEVEREVLRITEQSDRERWGDAFGLMRDIIDQQCEIIGLLKTIADRLSNARK